MGCFQWTFKHLSANGALCYYSIALNNQLWLSFSLTKNYKERPKYAELQEQPFFKDFEQMHVDVAGWFASVMESAGIKPNCR